MAEPIDEHFITTITAMADTATPRPSHHQPPDAASHLSAPDLLDLFDSQIGSRHLDLAARWLRAHGKGFYTIGSSGHESNAAVAAALRPTDPALLHYRSGGFFLQRARQVGGSDPLRDVLLGVVAATEDPISGGRHKVFGRHDLHIIPQTSTIASHLPRAVGVAFSIARAAKMGVSSPWPRRRDRSMQFRRRVGQPLHRRRCDQYRHSCCLPRASAPAAVRLRRQRHRHQHQNTERLDQRQLRKPPRPHLRRAPTAATCRRSTPPPAAPPSGCATTASRRSCICTWCG